MVTKSIRLWDAFGSIESDEASQRRYLVPIIGLTVSQETVAASCSGCRRSVAAVRPDERPLDL
jgi:hypothetical protein